MMKYYCEGCEQDLDEDEFGKHDELCNICYQSAVSAFEYRGWVSRGV
jgi:hypothetical protein